MGVMALTIQQFQAFAQAWDQSQLGIIGLDKESGEDFAQKLMNDEAFRQ